MWRRGVCINPAKTYLRSQIPRERTSLPVDIVPVVEPNNAGLDWLNENSKYLKDRDEVRIMYRFSSRNQNIGKSYFLTKDQYLHYRLVQIERSIGPKKIYISRYNWCFVTAAYYGMKWPTFWRKKRSCLIKQKRLSTRLQQKPSSLEE
ncbi:hypothetical protein ElyMa_006333400 [Elysia marginata]|uniref:Uncharacterized protein n=1 Tax=Elysia marginata TaxID=1093978 RepID=A0AAV4HJK2_9GAST|nr:hypothetical protein ElyMa_006333400 [Elysia marginata]